MKLGRSINHSIPHTSIVQSKKIKVSAQKKIIKKKKSMNIYIFLEDKGFTFANVRIGSGIAICLGGQNPKLIPSRFSLFACDSLVMSPAIGDDSLITSFLSYLMQSERLLKGHQLFEYLSTVCCSLLCKFGQHFSYIYWRWGMDDAGFHRDVYPPGVPLPTTAAGRRRHRGEFLIKKF